MFLLAFFSEPFKSGGFSRLFCTVSLFINVMPKGIPYRRDIRELIKYHWEYGKKPEEIFELLFMADENKGSLRRIQNLCRDFRKDADFSQSYSCGPHPQRITRESQRALSWEAVKAMMELRETDIEMNYKCLTRKFNLLWFGASTVNYVSLSTIRRHVTDRLRWSRKVLERRNVNIDPEMQLTFMEDMAVRDVNSFKDIDEMSISPSDFHKRYGYAPVGSDAIKTQIVIGTRSFSSIAMLGEAGIEAFDWIENETFDGERFAAFVNSKCMPVLFPGDIGILDNASIHRTTVAREAMEAAFSGDWTFCPPYSPQLKPIERVFALIKHFLRENETAALLDPPFWINSAFQRFSVDGSHNYIVSNFWNLYHRNRLSYLNSSLVV